MKNPDEKILVVKRDKLIKKPIHGFIPIGKFSTTLSHALNHIEVQRRGEMETDPTYKQLISYVLITNHEGEMLVYRRLTGGGESRLHGKLSLGIGGHMNPIDESPIEETLWNSLWHNTYREIDEEIGVKPKQIGLIGIVNDDTNDVGKVHFGLVYMADIGDTPIKVRETDTLQVRFMKHVNKENLETWSRMIVDAYER